MSNRKNPLFVSAIALVLCISMLIGTTFAWFTDVVTSGDNVIKSGSLDIGMYWSDNNADWKNTEGAGAEPIFNYDKWEPGYTAVRYVKVTNDGSLSFKYRMLLEPNGTVGKLAEVIDVSYAVVTDNASFVAPTEDSTGSLSKVGTLEDVIAGGGNFAGGVLLPEGETKAGYYSGEIVICIALHMQENAGNEYQNSSIGTTFDIKLLATQFDYESDAFGDQYDADAEWPDGKMSFEVSESISSSNLTYGELASDVVIRYNSSVYAVLPAGVKLADGVSSLKFSGKSVETGNNVTADIGDDEKNYDIHIEGIADDNTKCITVYLGAILPKGISDTELKLYHESDLMTRVDGVSSFVNNNQFTYDKNTGEVVIYVDNFSVFTAVQTYASVWQGDVDTSWYSDAVDEFILADAADFAGFRDLVDAGNTFEGKTVKLGCDIDLNNKPFDPIGFGYYNAETNTRVFMGTFDGGNHTVYNLYQNCWELDPDKENYSTYTYSTAGAGLFASIKDATIKNLAVSGAEIVFECVDMGVVVGYAQGTCHFENIVVSNSNIANYNRYTGGVVGEVSYGPYGIDVNQGYSHTFKNVVVDSTVKVSGLWGSFGCGMGGVIGGKWGDATVKMENVISAAEMDVYNDVTSAYQWYAFRGCGMLIGHTEEPYSDGRHSGNATASFLTCENVKVYYGDWVNYNYYEFENQDSATGRNYPWVRAEVGEYCDAFSNIRYGVPTHNGVKVSDLTEDELKAVATDYTTIVFDQLYGADRGMYGTATHEGVEVNYTSANAKTVFILIDDDDLTSQDLKLHYWYKNTTSGDVWTTIGENGISLESYKVPNYNVYKLDFPSFVEGFKIVGENAEDVYTFNPSALEDGATYTIDGDAHEHDFSNGNCACGAYEAQEWALVTDASELKAGEKIIIVANEYNVAISTNQKTNNRDQAVVTKDGNTLIIGDGVQIITLEAGKNNGTFAFNVGDGYLYAASSSSNHLRTEATLSDNSSWAITIDNNGVATIKAQGANKRNWLRYNSSDLLFSCYESGQKDISIYMLASSNNVMDPHNCLEYQTGATCEDNSTCTVCGKVIPNTALGHDIISIVTEATCTTGGYTTNECSRCSYNYVDSAVDAFGHNYVEGICDVCGALESEVQFDYSGRYYIATKRTTGNYFYMTSDLGTASTKRYQAVDSGLDTLPSSIITPEDGYVFTLEKNNDGTYSIYAEGVDGDNYLGWTSGNSGTLVAKSSAIKFTLDVNEGVYNIHFTASDAERYLALNGTSGNNYFAWYKSGQKQDLVLIPAGESENSSCEHTNTTTTTVDATCIVAGSVTITCDDCGETTSTEVIGALGHTTDNGTCERCGEVIGATMEPTEPSVVLEITKDDFNSTSYAANNNTKTEGDYSYTSYQVMLQSSAMQWQKNAGYITIASNEFVKLELKATAGTYTVTVGGETITGTTTDDVTTYDLSGLSGEIKISVSSATGKVDYLKFYK